MLVTLLSILASNAIALPLSPAFPVGELKYIMDNSGAKVLIATEKYGDKARDILKAGLERQPVLDVREKIKTGASAAEAVEFKDLEESRLRGGMMLYTSGTTNRPVGLPHAVVGSVLWAGWSDLDCRKECSSRNQRSRRRQSR